MSTDPANNNNTNMQFVCVDPDGSFHVTEQAKATFQSLQAPIRILSIVGRYRTGKSSLMNSIVGHSCFDTSSTVQAHTKGIVGHVLAPGTIVLDTEGLGSVQVSQNHDASIFALAMMVSSGCLLNTLGTITAQDIEDLRLAAKVAGLLTTHAGMSMDMPRLLWILRDFTLELKDRHGGLMDASGYLEECLGCHQNSTTADDVRRLFPHRECRTMPRPAASDEDVRDMQNLSTDFTDRLTALRSEVLAFPVKQRNGVPMDGKDLCLFLESLCDTLNTGEAVPCMDTVWDQILARSRENARLDAQAAFSAARTTAAGLPLACEAYRSRVFGDEIHPDELQELLVGLVAMDPRPVDLATRLEAQQVDLAAARDELDRSRQEGHARIDELMAEQTALHETLADHATGTLARNEQLRDLQRTLEDRDATITHITGDVQATMNHLRAHSATTEADLAQTLRERDTLRLRVQVAEKATADRTADVTQLERKYKQCSTQLEDSIVQLDEARTESQRIKRDVAVWTSRYDELNERSTKRNKVSEKRHIDSIQQSVEVTFLRERHEEMSTRCVDLQRELQAARRENQLLSLKSTLSILPP